MVPRVKKLFDSTSASPPGTANQQTRFANKLDAIAADSEKLLDDYAAAESEVASLPSVAKCSAGDALAKRLISGFKAIKIKQLWQRQVKELRRLATTARQPMSPKEVSKLHDSFAKLVEGLAGILDLAQNIRRLIEKHRERNAPFRNEQDLRRIVSSFARTSSHLNLKKIVAEFEPMFSALGHVDAATLDLCRAIEKIVGLRGKLTKAVRNAEESVIEQQDAIGVHLREFEDHARTFITAITQSEEYEELASLGDTSPFAPVTKAVEELVAVLGARLGITLAWLETIEKRQATSFILPGGLLNHVQTIAQRLRHAREQFDQYIQRYPGAAIGNASGASHSLSLEEHVLVGLGESERQVVEQIILAHERGGKGTTINAISAATGLKYATVRRILMQRLGPSLVIQKKQDRHGRSRGRGQASASPPDIFSIPEPIRASCRRWLETARKTP